VRTPSRWPRTAPNASGPSRPSHLACMRAIRPARRPTHSSHLAFARTQLRNAPPRSTSTPVGARRCARCLLPLLEYMRHSSLHPHPLDPPVHVHWSAEPLARRHCGRRGRPPPSSPPTVAEVVPRRTEPTNRPRVGPNPTLAAYSPKSGRPSPSAGLAPPLRTSLRGLKSFQEPKYRNQRSNYKRNLKP
jgi:hypothetical protein